MKKLFFIFLLITLPLQSSWAVAASYCQHEQTNTAHFGHHSHQHDLQNDAFGDASKLSSAHSDCGYCHLFFQASFSSAPLNMMLPNGPVQLAATPFHFSSHIPEGPKRPDWRLVV